VFGQLNNTIDERRPFFDYQMRTMAALIGLPAEHTDTARRGPGRARTGRTGS
jgi:hypothetical protein